MNGPFYDPMLFIGSAPQMTQYGLPWEQYGHMMSGFPGFAGRGMSGYDMGVGNPRDFGVFGELGGVPGLLGTPVGGVDPGERSTRAMEHSAEDLNFVQNIATNFVERKENETEVGKATTEKAKEVAKAAPAGREEVVIEEEEEKVPSRASEDSEVVQIVHVKPAPKRCTNRTCTGSIRSGELRATTVGKHCEHLCNDCHSAFTKGQFCSFCFTIYFDDHTDDDKDWVQCDAKHCKRWVHIDCEEKEIQKLLSRSDADSYVYRCPECRAEAPRGRKVIAKKPHNQRKVSWKARQIATRTVQSSGQTGSSTSRRRPVPPPTRVFVTTVIDVILNSYGVRLGLNESEINGDLNRLKRLSERSGITGESPRRGRSGMMTTRSKQRQPSEMISLAEESDS